MIINKYYIKNNQERVIILQTNSVYLLYLCDQWKTYRDRKLIGIFDNETKLRHAISMLKKDKMIDTSFSEDDIQNISIQGLHGINRLCLEKKELNITQKF